jgi:hypothetical protein
MLASIQLAAPQECPRLALKAKVHPNAKRGILVSKAKAKVSVTLRSKDPVNNLEFMLTLPNGVSVEKTATRPLSKLLANPEIIQSLDGTTNIYWRAIELAKNRRRRFRAKVKVDECAPETLSVNALAYFTNLTAVFCMTRLGSPAQLQMRYSKLKRKTTCAPTPAPSINPAQQFVLFGRGQRFSRGSLPAPFEGRRRSLHSERTNATAFLPSIERETRKLGISTPKDCYEYCSLRRNELVPFFFNWNTVTNQCFCCADVCTPFVFDPAYDMYEVTTAATEVPTSAPKSPEVSTAAPTGSPASSPTLGPSAIRTSAPTSAPTAAPSSLPTIDTYPINSTFPPTSFTPAPTPSKPVVIPTPEGQDVVVSIGSGGENTTTGSIQFANVISPGITVSRLI